VDSVFTRFDELQKMSESDPANKCSQRIKILIKNLFSEKESGWAKTKEAKKIQTKDQVAAQVLKQDAEKRRQQEAGDRNERDRFNDRGDNRDNRDKRQ